MLVFIDTHWAWATCEKGGISRDSGTSWGVVKVENLRGRGARNAPQQCRLTNGTWTVESDNRLFVQKSGQDAPQPPLDVRFQHVVRHT